MADYRSFECLNCGRSQKKTHPQQKFCKRHANGRSCKDRYWSRGTRRVSKMNIKLNALEALAEEMIELMKSNRARIEKLEKDLRATKELQLLLHQSEM